MLDSWDRIVYTMLTLEDNVVEIKCTCCLDRKSKWLLKRLSSFRKDGKEKEDKDAREHEEENDKKDNNQAQSAWSIESSRKATSYVPQPIFEGDETTENP